ncbi:TonB-dependent receptor SusC, partial [termite gut metagenome]
MKNGKTERRTRMKTFLLLMGGLLLSCGMFAQSGANVSMKGTVKDPLGEGIIGANIIVKGTTATGTITDFNGNFVLNAPANGVLVVSYVGYTTKEIPINGQTVLNIVLQENIELLSEEPPRMRMVAAPPGVPPLEITLTPAILPVIISCALIVI